VNDAGSLRAIPGPPDAVLPQAARGPLGLVLLDTRFPRPLGDAGNPQSWPGPVVVEKVERAWPDEVVTEAARLRASPLGFAFAAAMRRAQDRGARAITTSCGFLVLLQAELQAAVGVPVVTSSLLLLPGLLQREARVGVLTISAAALSGDHLLAAGVPAPRLADVAVQGVDPSGEFATAILGNRETMDLRRCEREIVQAALALQGRAPDITTLVLECTNMPPHAQAVRQATGWQVLSLFDAIR
jgi:hypothetical protein